MDKEKIKQKILQKMTEQWLNDNSGLVEDINKLSTEIMAFNAKWGAKLNAKDFLEAN